jgi:hypothetical protein
LGKVTRAKFVFYMKGWLGNTKTNRKKFEIFNNIRTEIDTQNGVEKTVRKSSSCDPKNKVLRRKKSLNP